MKGTPNRLTRNLSIVVIIIGFLYMIQQVYHGIYYNIPIFIALIGIASLNIFLIRRGYNKAANIIILTIINLIVYVFSASDPNHRAVPHVFFIAAAVTAFAVCGIRYIKLGLTFAIISVALFFVTKNINYSILPYMEARYTPDKFNVVFSINFLLCVFLVAAVVYQFIKLNHNNQIALEKKNEELIKANQKLDKMMYVVSHDLKAPLNSIRGLITLAEMSKDEADVKNNLKLMKDRTLAMEQFIHQVSNASRNVSESLNEPVQLQKLIDNIIESLRYDVNLSKLNFESNIPDDLILQSDPVRLKIVFGNLIANAAQYRDENKEVQYVKINCKKYKDQVEVIVEDNGVGIDDVHKEKVYEMFYRASRSSGGSGLGLYLVKETIHSLGVFIKMNSEVRKGTSFHVFLKYQPVVSN